MRERARCTAALPPHIVQLVRCLNLAQAIPVAWVAMRRVAGRVQEIQLAADANSSRRTYVPLRVY